jgi:hypothetical protein
MAGQGILKTPAGGPGAQRQKSVSIAPALGTGGTEVDDSAGARAGSDDDFPETVAIETQSAEAAPATASAPLPTYRQLIREARVLLAPGQLPEPLGREDKTAELKTSIVASLRILGAGRGVRPASAAKGAASPLDALQNLYVCGGPGMGKTLCVEKIMRELTDAHGGGGDCGTIDSPRS